MGLPCQNKDDWTGLDLTIKWKSSTAIDSSWINSSPTPNLSIKKSILSTVFLSSGWSFSYFDFGDATIPCFCCGLGWSVVEKSIGKLSVLLGSLSFKRCKSRPNISTKLSAFCARVFSSFNFLFFACLVLRSGIPAPQRFGISGYVECVPHQVAKNTNEGLDSYLAHSANALSPDSTSSGGR